MSLEVRKHMKIISIIFIFIAPRQCRVIFSSYFINIEISNSQLDDFSTQFFILYANCKLINCTS